MKELLDRALTVFPTLFNPTNSWMRLLKAKTSQQAIPYIKYIKIWKEFGVEEVRLIIHVPKRASWHYWQSHDDWLYPGDATEGWEVPFESLEAAIEFAEDDGVDEDYDPEE